MRKIKIKPFNSLDFTEREKICYYLLDRTITTITQCINEIDCYIGKIPKEKLMNWKRRLIKEMDKYEVCEAE